MPRAFRFAAPVVSPTAVNRPRLLRALVGRWEHRLTLVHGGPGLGKTTLLAQAIDENRLSPRGIDVWVGIEPGDEAGTPLATDVLAALDASGRAATPRGIAEAVWSRAPAQICVVLDDAHELPVGSAGAAFVAELLEELPRNGHLVLATRSSPTLPLARLAAHGELVEIVELDLRFDSHELAHLARSCALDDAALSETGGWPALAALTARGTQGRAGRYVWDEVLEPLGPERQRILAAVCDLGGADSDLVSHALGESVDLPSVLDGVPLIASDGSGWFEPHALWANAPNFVVDARPELRRRAVERCIERGQLDRAFDLLAGAQLWDLAPAVLREACLFVARPDQSSLASWLGRCPDEVHGTAPYKLADGVLAEMAASESAPDLLRAAVAAFRDEGDVDGEVSAITHLGRVAFWRQDLSTLAEFAPRVSELAAAGSPQAAGLNAVGAALVKDLMGDDDGALAALDSVPSGALDPWWQGVTVWMREAVLEARDGFVSGVAMDESTVPRVSDPLVQLTLGYGRWLLGWQSGLVDEAVAFADSVVANSARVGGANVLAAAADAARACAYVGDLDRAERFLSTARAHGPGRGAAAVRLALAEAAWELANGNEAGAAEILRRAIEAGGLDSGSARRAWREALPLTYVLVPETRAHWDSAPLREHWLVVRDLARSVAARRDAEVPDPLSELRSAELAVARGVLPFRFAAELGVALHQSGRVEGDELTDALGPPGRAHVRSLTSAPDLELARAARSLLGTVPASPITSLSIDVLGPVRLWRGGVEVHDSALRRDRVRSLLAFLVLHRDTTRAAVLAALWPDFDDRSGANNLRVTLNHLAGLLEPERAEGEAPYYLRTDGSALRLVTKTAVVDLDRFEEETRDARKAEGDGAPSVALGHHLTAADLYRGTLFSGVADAEWMDLAREQARSRFVSSAVRAAELLQASGEPDRAAAYATRAIAEDPWSEDAHCVLVDAALSAGDRSAAVRLLERCREMLQELGVKPSETTEGLGRRLAAASS